MNHRYSKIAAACVAAAGLATVTPAMAQNTGAGNGANGDTTTQREDGGNWGWIGLLGLLGLMGMRRKHDDNYPTARRDNMGRA